MNKVFSKQTTTKVKLKKLIRDFASKLEVRRVVFGKQGIYVRGTYNVNSGVIFINVKQTKKELLNTFFHELGHHTAVMNNKWKKYHHCLVPSVTAKYMFFVENKVDHIGKQLWNKYVDIKQWGKYKFCYPKAHKAQYIKQIINK